MKPLPRVYYWLPTLFWMVVIFGFSSRPPLHVSPVAWQDFLIKKCAHVTEYFILGCLLYFSLHRTTNLTKKSIIILLIAIGLIYASSDEFHQTFVSGRDGRVRDILIDSMGIFGSATILTFFSFNFG